MAYKLNMSQCCQISALSVLLCVSFNKIVLPVVKGFLHCPVLPLAGSKTLKIGFSLLGKSTAEVVYFWNWYPNPCALYPPLGVLTFIKKLYEFLGKLQVL